MHDQILEEVLPTSKEKSIGEKEVLTVVEEEGRTWMTPIHEYLTKEILPEEKRKARTKRRKAGSMHACLRSVVAKALRSRYYWPTMHADARKLIRECNSCQVLRPVPRNPQQNLTPITSPWPFYKWGIDIVGPFLECPGKVKFLIVAIDYFTKWIEAKPIATITGAKIKKFMWDNIVYRPSGRDKRTGSNPGSKKAKLRWNNTTMLEFAIQVSIQETSSTGTMKRAMQKMESSSDLLGKDHMRSRKH
ncbi:reverse transcriptase domain-containing protein [Tanacetum coccineum]